MPHARAVLSLLSLLLACTAAPPPPTPAQATPTPAPVTTPVTPTPPPVTATPTPAANVAPPRSASAPWTTLPEGLVPRALVQDVSLVPIEPPILVRAAKCDAPKLGGDCNYGVTEILGFNADAVTLMYAPESGHPEIWPLVGELVGLDGKSRERTTITRTGELEGSAYKAARLKGWKWFAGRARAGDTAPRPLLWALGSAGVDESMHAPLAFLSAPLAGWMLHLEVPAVGDEMLLQLISPDNQAAHRLAALPIRTADRCRDDDGEPVQCPRPLRLDLASIDAAALDPARTHLVVLYTLRAVGSASEHTRWAIHPLPDAVRPTP